MTVGRILVAKGRDVVTIQPHRSVLDAAGLLARKGIGALIVVDSETRVRGVFSERDLVRLLAKPLGIAEGGVAWEAHAGGFIVGFLIFGLFDPVRESAQEEGDDAQAKA